MSGPRAQDPSGRDAPLLVDAAGNLKIAGTFSAEPPVGGATEAKQDALIAKLPAQEAGRVAVSADDKPFKQIIDEATSTVTYICEAAPGTASSAAAWRVQRITVAGTVTTISYAGTGAFDQVADNRAALAY